jgi:hypothetical protein
MHSGLVCSGQIINGIGINPPFKLKKTHKAKKHPIQANQQAQSYGYIPLYWF